MLYVSKMSKMAMSAEDAVRRLALERPEWLSVLRAALIVAKRAEPFGGELKRTAGQFRVNNLRTLVAFGLLEPSGDATRGGNRRYCRIPDREGIERALRTWEEHVPKGRLSFIGAAASGFTDVAGRAGEIGYEPDPWR